MRHLRLPDSKANLQKIQRKQDAELHHENAISRIWTVGNCTSQMTQVFHQMYYKLMREMEGESVDSNRLKRRNLFLKFKL